MTAKVLLLGASRYYSRSIRSVREAGFEVLVADRQADSPGFAEAHRSFECDITNLRGIEQIASVNQVDVIVPLNDYGVITASIVSDRLGLPGIAVEAAQCATNKQLMRERWREVGLRSPHFEIYSDEELIFDAICRLGIPCILKPAHAIGGGSRGVSVVSDLSTAQIAIAMAKCGDPQNSVLVESFLPGDTEHSCEILIRDGETRIIAIGDKEKTPLPYRVDRSIIYPTVLSPTQVGLLDEVVQVATDSLGLNVGTAHFEFSADEDGIFPFEIGARCGGGATPEPIVSYMTGVHLVVEQVRSLLQLTADTPVVHDDRGCVYRFLILPEGKVQRVWGWPPSRPILDGELFVQSGSRVEQVRTGHDRSGFVVVGGRNRNEAIERADFIESQLRVEYA